MSDEDLKAEKGLRTSKEEEVYHAGIEELQKLHPDLDINIYSRFNLPYFFMEVKIYAQMKADKTNARVLDARWVHPEEEGKDIDIYKEFGPDWWKMFNKELVEWEKASA